MPEFNLRSNQSSVPLFRLGTDVDKLNAATGNVVGSFVDRFIPPDFSCQCPAINSAGIPDISVRRPRLKRVVKRKKPIWTGEYKRHIGNWAKMNRQTFRDAMNNPRLPPFPEQLKFKDGPNPNFLRFYFSCGRQWNHEIEREENIANRCDYFGWADKVIDEKTARAGVDSMEEADAVTLIFDYIKADQLYHFDDMYLSKRILTPVKNVVNSWIETEATRRTTSESDEGRPADTVADPEPSGENGPVLVGNTDVILAQSNPQPASGEGSGTQPFPQAEGQQDVATSGSG